VEQVNNRFRAALETGEFLLTAELGPPKGTDVSAFVEKGKTLSQRFHGLNVTDNQSSVMRLSSLAGSVHLREAGVTPIMQMTCRDRNRLAIQSDLLGAWSFGIENLLVLTGDHPRFGDHPTAKAVYDLDSVQLLDTVRRLNEGFDLAGKQLKGKTDFVVGAAASPVARPLEPELLKFDKKVEAGAVFFQTQAVFAPESLESFMAHARTRPVKIIAGVLVLKSARMIEFINANVPGLDVPPDIEAAIRKAADPVREGIRVAGRIVSEIRELVDGVHIMAIGNEECSLDVLEEAGI
jgi:5,10-methylenetetrahydrofolate reductase